MVEIKSGALYPVVGIQLALQARIAAPVSILKRYAVQLKENGKYHLEPYKDRDDYKVALSAVNICHWKRRNGK